MRALWIIFVVSLAGTSGASAAGIDLGGYTAGSPRIELGATVAQDASGLTYNAVTGTLFVTRNNGPERLFEIDTSGNVRQAVVRRPFRERLVRDDVDVVGQAGTFSVAGRVERRFHLPSSLISP